MRYFNFYNSARFHQSLDYSVPDEMYEAFQYNGLEDLEDYEAAAEAWERVRKEWL